MVVYYSTVSLNSPSKSVFGSHRRAQRRRIDHITAIIEPLVLHPLDPFPAWHSSTIEILDVGPDDVRSVQEVGLACSIAVDAAGHIEPHPIEAG
jgi:hypothetical protein